MSEKENLPFKFRIIHAISYELILLLIGTPLLSYFFKQNLAHTTILWVSMVVISLIWNLVFNPLFEKLERKMHWEKRTIGVRILHAIGFEGGLTLFTTPVIAYMLQLSLWKAFILDIGMVFAIVFYTFIFQWCFDTIMDKYVLNK